MKPYSLALLLLLVNPLLATAASYPMPPLDIDIIGQDHKIRVNAGDTLTSIGEQQSIGHDEILRVNPQLRTHPLKTGDNLLIPSSKILPNRMRTGIVINVSEARLYYYSGNIVETFPIAIGREDWHTPKGVTMVVEKTENPTWIVPASVKAYARSQGISLPDEVPPGPDNPLGKHRLRLDIPGYLIHGTNDPSSIGRRETSGCVRMYPNDVAYLFTQTELGTPVEIINMPYKLGWYGDVLYAEAHPPVLDPGETEEQYHQRFMEKLREFEREYRALIDWKKVTEVLAEKDGRVYQIGHS